MHTGQGSILMAACQTSRNRPSLMTNATAPILFASYAMFNLVCHDQSIDLQGINF
jgi:hypothetical protein